MDTAKAVSLHVRNEGDVLTLGYHDPRLLHGLPLVAVPTTAGTGAETNTYGVITDEAAGRKAYVGHPSVLPIASVLDPELTVGLPPAPTAATGVDAMTHSLESLLSRNPNPFAEAIALLVIRTVSDWLPRAVEGRRRTWRRGASCWSRPTSPASARRAARGSGLSTQSAMPSGRAGSCPTAPPWPPSCPRSSRRTGTSGSASWPSWAWRCPWRVRDDPPAEAATAAIDGLKAFLERVSQRRTLLQLGIGPDARGVDRRRRA